MDNEDAILNRNGEHAANPEALANGNGKSLKKPKKAWPKIIKVGHTVVRIYHSLNRGCDSYTVVHYPGDKRIRQHFSALGLATTAAQTLATIEGEE